VSESVGTLCLLQLRAHTYSPDTEAKESQSLLFSTKSVSQKHDYYNDYYRVNIISFILPSATFFSPQTKHKLHISCHQCYPSCMDCTQICVCVGELVSSSLKHNVHTFKHLNNIRLACLLNCRQCLRLPSNTTVTTRSLLKYSVGDLVTKSSERSCRNKQLYQLLIVSNLS
jgi:hypothetical protein